MIRPPLFQAVTRLDGKEIPLRRTLTSGDNEKTSTLSTTLTDIYGVEIIPNGVDIRKGAIPNLKSDNFDLSGVTIELVQVIDTRHVWRISENGHTVAIASLEPNSKEIWCLLSGHNKESRERVTAALEENYPVVKQLGR